MTHHLTLLPGDGIGPEVTEAAVRVIEAAGVNIEWDRHRVIGATAVERGRPALPPDVIDSIQERDAALKGPVTTPVGQGFTSVNVQLRQRLDLYANVRPATSLQGLDTPFDDVDLIIFRENTEGLYSGIEYFDERLEIADSIARVTKRAHKANILKKASGLFLDIGRDVAAEYPEIEFDDSIIDNLCMQLVTNPENYDCIVSTNLFGDILSDLTAGLVGGLGVTPGANIGDELAVFEAVHGSAPDIAGQNVANPTAMIRTAVMMLRHLDEDEAANAIEDALFGMYRRGDVLTQDVGGDATTSEFADALTERVAETVDA
ncbi:MAG: NAD-dependent isocitrate dehydrogenase [Bacteroidetes bacterium QH_2_63_10]|nr:MAG: NAD-dependent isocitrate dehydrogenase [Bacteroidetes bacterium QH_2_63_10]